MAAASLVDSKRKYSWWWDSHISPKNSKWLQENLTDMDVKVKQMIKLIEEDADSFARRAEMYYKKRPELMKLVEEFYRAYRALAERYDHATGALRQAQKTMAEAFPNQIPFLLSDDSHSGFSTDDDRHLDPDEQQNDVSVISTKRNGTFTNESDSVPGRKGFKQLNDLFGSGNGVNHAKFADGRARKGLNFNEVGEKGQGMQNGDIHDGRAFVSSESERITKAEQEILSLKYALAKVEAEKEANLLQYQHDLERLSYLQSEVSRAQEESKGFSERASKADAEVQSLKEALAKLDTEREASLSKYQQCLDKISNLENNISLVQKDAGELNERASNAEMEAQSLKKDIPRLEAEKEAAVIEAHLLKKDIAKLEAEKEAAVLEAQSLKEDIAGLEAEKEAAVVQYEQCLQMISALEQKLLHAEEESRRSSKRADDAEREVETLKHVVIKLADEKEAAAANYLQCLETIASLEHKLACAVEEVERLRNERDEGAVKLEGAEEKCSLLERSNQNMHSELEAMAQKVAAQSEELTEKQKELGRLWTCIQEEHLRFVEAETAFQTLQDLHSQSQEELRSTAAQLKDRVQILEDLEARNQILLHEIEAVRVENRSLSDVNLSSAVTIKSLHDEITELRETIRKLEAEVELRVDQRNALQQEIYCLKEELNDLNKKHQAIMAKVESVGFTAENFGSSMKELQDENIKLKEVCEKDRNEKVALLGKLEIMEKLVEKNALLENSLSDLNVELEEDRKKVNELEESCQSLSLEKSTLASEKAALMSELQTTINKMEKLTEKNYFLENSLLDANTELEALKLKLKNLEESCLFLEKEKSELTSLRGSLISDLNITQKGLEEFKKNHTDLEHKYFSLEKDKELVLHEVEKFQVSLAAEKQEHASLAQRSKTQLADMESRIHLLQDEAQYRQKEYEEELDKAVHADMEIFILQKCMQDLEEKNVSLSLEHQKLSEASTLLDKLICELKVENLRQQTEVNCLFDQLNSLRGGLCQVLTIDAPVANREEFKVESDQALLNHIRNKLLEAQKFCTNTQDESQQLFIENSVLVALLGQLQQELANLVSAKSTLDQELRARSEHVMALKCESQNLSEVSEALRLKVLDGDRREEILKDENQQLLIEKSVLVALLGQLQQELAILVSAKSTLDQELKTRSEHVMALKCESQNLSEVSEALRLKVLDGDRIEEILKDENQQLFIENSVLVALLGQLQQELANLVSAKSTLDQELRTRSEHVMALKCESQNLSEVSEALRLKVIDGDRREEILKDEITNLQRQLSEMECSCQNLQSEKCKVLDELRSLMNTVSDLSEENNTLKYENSTIFVEAVSQSTLSVTFEALIREKFEEIKELSKNLNDILHENLGLKKTVKIMTKKLDELGDVVHAKAELHNMVEDLKLKYDEGETRRLDLGNKHSQLTEDYQQLRKDAEFVQEENQKLEAQLLKLRGEFQEIILREESLNCEVLKGRNEIELWETSAAYLYQEQQMSAVREAVFEAKARDLIQVCENLEDRNCLKAMEIDQLKEKVATLEHGNAEQKAQMMAYVPAFMSLQNSVVSLENHILSDEKPREANMEAKDAAVHVSTGSRQMREEVSGGFAELQELEKKITAIENAAREKERLLLMENLNANSKLETLLKQIEEINSGNNLHSEVFGSGKHVNQKQGGVEVGAAPSDGLWLPQRTHEIMEEGSREMTKDIMLDQTSECSSYGISRRETAETDEMLETWKTTDRNGSIDLTVEKNQKGSTTSTKKKHKGENLSTESLVEKEVAVDRLEISKRLSGSFQEGNGRKILERLDSDAQKLTNLQITVQDLKKKVETTEKSIKGNGMEYDNVKEQLEESEEAIMKLFDVNRRLMKSIEANPVPSDDKSSSTPDDSVIIQRRKASEQARRVSEKIGRLQLEVQKLQFLLLKLDDENKSRGKSKTTEKNARVLLRDYLYGKRKTNQKRTKKHFCSCMQPPTNGD